MSSSVTALLLNYWQILVPVIAAAYFVNNYFNHGLHKYPGPFWANFSDVWRFVDVAKRNPQVTQLRLHRQHGDVVRLGPNVLSFSSPAALKTIYGLKKGMTKSGFYPVQQAISHGQRLPSLFSTTDEQYHASLRRCVNSAFSMSSLVQYEPLVDRTLEVFLDKTNQFFASSGKDCDFAEWLQFFAFDVVGQLTYSNRHGFIDKNEDIDGMVGYLSSLLSYFAPVGQMPWLDVLLLKNPIVRLADRLGMKLVAHPVSRFANKHVTERRNELRQSQEKGEEEAAINMRPDLLSMFLKAQIDHPEVMTDVKVLTMAVSMTFAGSETTAISAAAVFYYLLRNPDCYDRLMQELNKAVEESRIADRESGVVSWAESLELPYLDACIKEAFRLHPAPGLLMERVTPPQGITIDGHFVPGDTIVGCNAWVIHKREEIFGRDIDAYRPQRWLEASDDQLKEMNANMFQFGAGARTCIGKNISLLEMYKLVPSMLRRFEIVLTDPTREWKLHNAWFVSQKNFVTRFKARKLRI